MNNQYKKKIIKYDWDGGEIVKIKAQPNSDFSYVAGNNSDGILNQDFSECNSKNSNLSYSIFFNCSFRKTNMENVNIEESIFPQCDFRDAKKLTSDQKKYLRKKGAILTNNDLNKLKNYLNLKKEIYKRNSKLEKELKKNNNKIKKLQSSKWEINY